MKATNTASNQSRCRSPALLLHAQKPPRRTLNWLRSPIVVPLTIYLDRLRTNDPVTNAAVTVETPAGSVVASPEHDGTYRLDAPWAVKPGLCNLIFTVEADGMADVLIATL